MSRYEVLTKLLDEKSKLIEIYKRELIFYRKANFTSNINYYESEIKELEQIIEVLKEMIEELA